MLRPKRFWSTERARVSKHGARVAGAVVDAWPERE